MRHLIFALAILTLAAMTAAIADTTAAVTPSPFTGRYVGKVSANGKQAGWIYLNVGADGNITGTGLVDAGAKAQNLTGSILNTGVTQITPADGVTPLTGTLTLTVNVLNGTLSSGGRDYVFSLPSAAGGTSPNFSGAIAGNFGLNNCDAGTINLVVDANGAANGIATDTTASQDYVLTGTITTAGVAKLSIGSGPVTGTLIISPAKIVTGTLTTNAGGDNTTITIKATLT